MPNSIQTYHAYIKALMTDTVTAAHQYAVQFWQACLEKARFLFNHFFDIMQAVFDYIKAFTQKILSLIKNVLAFGKWFFKGFFENIILEGLQLAWDLIYLSVKNLPRFLHNMANSLYSFTKTALKSIFKSLAISGAMIHAFFSVTLDFITGSLFNASKRLESINFYLALPLSMAAVYYAFQLSPISMPILFGVTQLPRLFRFDPLKKERATKNNAPHEPQKCDDDLTLPKTFTNAYQHSERLSSKEDYLGAATQSHLASTDAISFGRSRLLF